MQAKRVTPLVRAARRARRCFWINALGKQRVRALIRRRRIERLLPRG